MAYMTIQARWLISEDDQFCEIGPRTGIDWMDAFVSYKRILVLYADNADIKDLFNSLNQQIFGREPTAADVPNPPVPEAPQAPKTAFERMEQALAAEQAAQGGQTSGEGSGNDAGDVDMGNVDTGDQNDSGGAIEGEDDAGQCRS
jgi:hypothetical protein